MTKSDAICAKTARACDYCIRRRARWYCAADDAFLCQACDSSVHTANPLARRHERVRLNTASLKCSSEEKACIPSWHRGVHRKARTPRHGKQQFKLDVPELGRSSTTTSNDDSDQMQVLYRVPILDPFVSELCSPSVTSNELTAERESKYTEMILLGDDNQNESLFNLDLDMDMAEFAADVESLLGKGLDNESYGIEELGLLDCHGRGTIVKDEEDDIVPSGHNMDVIGDPFPPFELSFDYNSPVDVKELEDKSNINDEKHEWRISLRLDYDAITTAWASQGSPWVNGERPMINPNDCWFHGTMGGDGTVRPFGEAGMIAKIADGGREARVSRYREKRRTRLFSKKIRYEVRKLNAEKRPRMKGRFVKRSSLAICST